MPDDDSRLLSSVVDKGRDVAGVILGPIVPWDLGGTPMTMEVQSVEMPRCGQFVHEPLKTLRVTQPTLEQDEGRLSKPYFNSYRLCGVFDTAEAFVLLFRDVAVHSLV